MHKETKSLENTRRSLMKEKGISRHELTAKLHADPGRPKRSLCRNRRPACCQVIEVKTTPSICNWGAPTGVSRCSKGAGSNVDELTNIKPTMGSLRSTGGVHH